MVSRNSEIIPRITGRLILQATDWNQSLNAGPQRPSEGDLQRGGTVVDYLAVFDCFL